jgi:hypothetical protein
MRIFSTDHKIIGLQYAVTSLAFLLFGFLLILRSRLLRLRRMVDRTGGIRVDSPYERPVRRNTPTPNLARGVAKAACSQAALGNATHLFDRPPNVRGTREPQCVRATTGLFEKVCREPH